jgi:MFS transporter, DHA2 family, multidrug resistance protein
MANATATIGRDEAETGAVRRAVVLATLTFVTMLYTMTVMIANVALPKMQGTFAATTDQIALVVTFNIVATAVVTPMSGWLASRFSRRTLMLACTIGFTLASLGCGLAQSLEQLVFFRILQGGFGAPLVPLNQAILLDTFPRRQHGTATAFFGMGVVFGPIIGPTVGGYLAEAFGWRWVFFLIIPFGILATLAVLAVIDDRRKAAQLRLDWAGLILLSIAIAALQLMLDRGQRLDWFDSAEIIAELAIALLAFYLFAVHTMTVDTPFLDPRMLLDRNYAIGMAIAILFGAILWTPMVIFPPMLQQMQNYPENVIGLFLALRGIGTFVGTTLMVFINRLFDPRVLLSAGFLMQGIAGWYMAGFDVNLSAFDLIWTNALAGLGVGFVWVPLTVITFATLDRRYLNDATALFHLLRNVGSSISISLSIVLLTRVSQASYADLTPAVTIFGEASSVMALKGGWPTSSASELMTLSAEIRRQAGMIGYVATFHAYALTAFAVLPFIALVRMKSRAP